MPALVILACLICAFSQVLSHNDSNVAAIRFAHFEVLSQQFVTAANSDKQISVDNSVKNNGDQHLTRVSHEFVPKFLALAEEDPADETALRCCEWIIAYGTPSGSDREMYEADCAAWEILRKHQSWCDHLPLLCLKAAQHPTQERERFLRALPDDYRQPVEVHGVAFLALADLLALKCEIATDKEIVGRDSAPEWRDYITSGHVKQQLTESKELYLHVLKHYAGLPIPMGVTKTGKSQTLGEVAAKNLKALKSPKLARKVLPNRTTISTQGLDHLSGN